MCQSKFVPRMNLAAQSLRAHDTQQAVQQQQEAIRWYRRAAKSGEPVSVAWIKKVVLFSRLTV